MHARRWPGILFYVVAVLAIALDQATKAWAMASLEPLGSVPVVPGFFSLTYVRNTGVAFGMFAGQEWLVAAFMVVLAGVALWYARGLDWARREPNVVGGVLVGGALGNLIDRWRFGHVIDFFDVYVGPHHWPVFNVADSLICLAVGWIVLRSCGRRSCGGQ
jgi:signal peptidase II